MERRDKAATEEPGKCCWTVRCKTVHVGGRALVEREGRDRNSRHRENRSQQGKELRADRCRGTLPWRSLVTKSDIGVSKHRKRGGSQRVSLHEAVLRKVRVCFLHLAGGGKKWVF